MTAHARRRLRSALAFCAASLALAAALATLATVLFALDQRLLASVAPVRLGLWWWLRLLAFYLPLSMAGAAIAAAARPRPVARRLLTIAALGGVGGVLAANRDLLAVLIDSPSRTRLLLAVALIAAPLAIACVFASTRRGAAAPTAAALAVAALVLGLRPPAASPIAPPSTARIESIRSRAAERLLVVGLDGADWTFIDALVAAGDLPHLARLKAEGAWGDLKTLRPTSSPLLWTSVVTGKRPEDHGVLRITVFRPKGLHVGFQGRAIHVRRLGIEWLRRLLRKTGQLVQSPVTGAERRVPAFWNIAGHFGRPVSVSSWWATWPAERILGRMVSDRVFYDRAWAQGARDAPDRFLTFPDELAVRMRRLAVHPQEIGPETWRRFLDVTDAELAAYRQLAYSHHDVRSELPLYLAMFESDRRFVRELVRQDEASGRTPGDLMVLYRLVDQMSHCCLRFSGLVEDHLDASADDLRRFGRATAEAYRALDAELGELLERFGPANVVLLSDHGFTLEQRPTEGPRYAHNSAPAGIFLGVGPAFRPGEVRGLSLFDMMPLLLHLKGLPVAKDLVRPLRSDLFDPRWLAAHPPETIDSYGFVPVVRGEAPGSRADEKILEELRALGYIG